MKVFKFVVFAVLVFGMSQNTVAQTGKTNSSESIKNLISKKREFNAKYGYGFRIQIYYGNETEARKLRNSFRRNFPKTKSYLKYKQPYWKVLVGDYKNKLQADRASIDFSEKFAGLIIVPLGK
jgi:hypothetical protein